MAGNRGRQRLFEMNQTSERFYGKVEIEDFRWNEEQQRWEIKTQIALKDGM